MNSRAATVLGFAGIALILGGCGTFENLHDAIPPKYSCDAPMKTVYGGVGKDWHTLNQAWDSDTPDWKNLLLMSLDLPFTLVGDTVTLPYILAFETGVFGLTRECHFP